MQRPGLSEARPPRVLERVVEAPEGPPERRRLGLAAGLALLGCTLVTALVAPLFPVETRMSATFLEREEFWRAQAGRFDLAYFGTSHVEVGILPRVVDERLAELGHACTSFNFGLGGASAFEVDFVLRRIVASKGPRLATVVIEVPDWRLPEGNRRTERAVAWHDARQTWSALRAPAGEEGLLERLGLATLHLQLFLQRLTGLGAGPETVRQRLLGRGDERPSRADLERTRGYYEREREEEYARLRDRLLASTRPGVRAKIADYERRVAGMAPGGDSEQDIADYPLALLRRQREFLEAHGLRVIYLVTPVPYRTPWAERLARAGELPVLLAFNDVERYPELLDVEVHFGETHLTREGAELFSRRLAERLAEVLPPDEPGR